MSGQLQRVVLERRADGLWDVTRERAETGESAVGLASLDECFAYVRAAYAPDGQPLRRPMKVRRVRRPAPPPP